MTMVAIFDKQLVVVERHRALRKVLPAAALASLVGFVACFNAAATTTSLVLLSLFACSLGVSAGLTTSMWIDNWHGSERARRVIASREGVRIEGVRAIARADIDNARLIPRAGRMMLRLYGRAGVPLFDALVSTKADAVAFLQAIGGVTSYRKAHFAAQLFADARKGYAFVLTSLLLIANGFPVLLSVLGPLLGTITILPLMLAPLVLLFGVEVEVGTDGVLVSRPGRKQWIAFDDVRAVERTRGCVRFVLHHGEHVDVAPMAGDAFLTRVTEAFASHRASAGPTELATKLARRGRPRRAWRNALLRLRDATAGYRSAAVRDEDLWRVVHDPAAPEDARVAAAFVLRRPGEKSEAHVAARLRIAAQAVAAPFLHGALIAEDADEMLSVETELLHKRSMVRS